MIKLRNLSYSIETVVSPTIFPDKTSQVWKLSESVLVKGSLFHIVWEFESEAELIHLIQLGMLLKNYGKIAELSIPYLPYARQDKDVSNSNTFALAVLVKTLKTNFEGVRITAIDLHSEKDPIISLSPGPYIQKAIKTTEANLVCFPDEGASKRYAEILSIPHIDLTKTRDQSSGQITDLNVRAGYSSNIVNKKVLIIDDICDGGMTFILAAKALYFHGAKEVHLYTTHGLYSKDTKVLFEANIKRIFNRKGEVYAQ